MKKPTLRESACLLAAALTTAFVVGERLHDRVASNGVQLVPGIALRIWAVVLGPVCCLVTVGASPVVALVVASAFVFEPPGNEPENHDDLFFGLTG